MNSEKEPSRKQQDSKGSSGGQNLLWYLLIAGLGIVAVTVLLAQNAVLEISYYDFQRLIDASRRDDSGQMPEGAGYIDVRIELKDGKQRIDRRSPARSTGS